VNGRARASSQPNAIGLSAARARSVPATNNDALLAASTLPGVANTTFSPTARSAAASGLVVWGSSPRETKFVIDGVEVPWILHSSGLASVMLTDTIARFDLVPGGFGADYGRGTGGLVRVTSRALAHQTEASAAASALDGWLRIATFVGPNVRLAASARQSWLDPWLRVAGAESVRNAVIVPTYQDTHAKISIDAGHNQTLDIVWISAGEVFRRSTSALDFAHRVSDHHAMSFWRSYMHYTHKTGSADAVVVTPYVGRDVRDRIQTFGESQTRLRVASTVSGLRASMRSRGAKGTSLTLGLDALGTSSRLVRRGSLTLPPREGDITVFGQSPGDDVAFDAWRTYQLSAAPFVHADITLGPVVVSPGLRLETLLTDIDADTPSQPLSIGGQSGHFLGPRQPPASPPGTLYVETTVAPRVAVRTKLSSRVTVTGTWGVYHQPPDPEDVSSTFGSPNLELAKATHTTCGPSLSLSSHVSADAVVFYKRYSHLPVRSAAQPLERAHLLTSDGEGRSYGTQLTLRLSPIRGWSGWLSYTLSRSERFGFADSDHRDVSSDVEAPRRWRLFDADQPHTLSVVAQFQRAVWLVSARLRASSGAPYAPVVASTYDARRDQFDPVFAAQNSDRLPMFFQLDVHAERTFSLSESITLRAFIDVINATHHTNTETLAYSADYTQKNSLTGLPLIAFGGMQVEFKP